MFMKDDKAKNRLELIDPEFILGLGAVLTFGADKYEANNWKLGGSDKDLARIRGAMLRHQMALATGEEVDPESGINHTYHIACNAMFLAYHSRNDRVQTVMVFEDDGGTE